MDTPHDHMLRIPHAQAIGIALVRHDEHGCVVRAPYAEHLVGDPDSGVIHGGVLTALLDNACGMAVRPAGMETDDLSMATLDLRIDYMGPAEPRKDVFAEAVCYKRTRHIAFVRATAYQDSAAEPIATCVASFMLGTANAPEDRGRETAPTETAPTETGPTAGYDS